MLELGTVILRLERARRELLTTDVDDKEKLLAASRKVDKLVIEYYRTKREDKSYSTCSRQDFVSMEKKKY